MDNEAILRKYKRRQRLIDILPVVALSALFAILVVTVLPVVYWQLEKKKNK